MYLCLCRWDIALQASLDIHSAGRGAVEPVASILGSEPWPQGPFSAVSLQKALRAMTSESKLPVQFEK